MNTDKIYAEQIANEYAPKDTSKVVALRQSQTSRFDIYLYLWCDCRSYYRSRNVSVDESNRRRFSGNVCTRCGRRNYRICRSWNQLSDLQKNTCKGQGKIHV